MTPEFGQQLIAFLPNMRRFAISLCRSSELADDLVQSACERALASADSFEPGTRFDSWIFRIIRNLWIDRLRKSKTEGIQEDIEEQFDLVGSHGEQVQEARLALSDTAKAIAALPDDQREVLLLVCVEDFSYQETSETLDIPIGTVMSRLARARKKIIETTGIKPSAGRSAVGKGKVS